MPKKSEKKQKEVKEEKTESKKLSKEEFEKEVLELAKTGLTSEKIGEHLRRQNIHPKEHTKISAILKKHKVYVNPDLKNLDERLNRVRKHSEKNKQDKRALRDVARLSSVLRQLRKYYNKIADK